MLQTRIKNRLIRRGIVALALLATLPGAPVAAGQTFDEAVAAYDRGDYATAVRGFLVHAEQGDATAQYNLGVMYNYGEGVPEDDAEAVRWYRLAAEQGHASAQSNFGAMYALGQGVLKDSVLAYMWSNIAGANGNASARKLRDSLERDMTRAEVSRATELARACMTSRTIRTASRKQGWHTPWWRFVEPSFPRDLAPFPSRRMIPDRSSPSRVRFAASRPRPLRADPKDALLTRGKGVDGPWGARAGR